MQHRWKVELLKELCHDILSQFFEVQNHFQIEERKPQNNSLLR